MTIRSETAIEESDDRVAEETPHRPQQQQTDDDANSVAVDDDDNNEERNNNPQNNGNNNNECDNDDDDDITVVVLESGEDDDEMIGSGWIDQDSPEIQERRRNVLLRELQRVQRASFIHFMILCLIPTSLLFIVIATVLGEDDECESAATTCAKEPRTFISTYWCHSTPVRNYWICLFVWIRPYD